MEFLLSSGDEARFALPSYPPNNNETAELCKGLRGECVWTGSEKQKAPVVHDLAVTFAGL